jgi:glycosyltransferase involved in cell wall biosynthesis
MIEGRTILCFASGYDAPPTSKHHVMHLLAERNVVLWVNYHASRAPTASASDLAYMLRKLRQIFAGMKTPRKNFHVLTPMVVPLPGSPAARRLNRWLLLRQIRRALRKVAAGPLQIWSFTPDISYVLGHFGEEKVVYYCVDDHASFSGYDREQVLRDEADLCRRADLVVTTSMALQESKSPLNPHTVLVTHGVDYEHFARAASEDLPVPPDIRDIPRPRLGFFGLVRDWVDLDLVAAVARARPEWHVVLIGDSTVDLAPYRGVANMHFLGRKSYDDLPAYCRQFDVGLIPFKVNELTRAVNPIKLREYLAAGLPVVSTPMPEVQLYSRLIEIADTPQTFAAAVERALAAPPQARLERTRAMAAETWLSKLKLIGEHLAAAARPSADAAGTPCDGGSADAARV